MFTATTSDVSPIQLPLVGVNYPGAESSEADIEAARDAGYSVHGHYEDDTFAWCIEGDYSDEYDTEGEAWDAAVADHQTQLLAKQLVEV